MHVLFAFLSPYIHVGSTILLMLAVKVLDCIEIGSGVVEIIAGEVDIGFGVVKVIVGGVDIKSLMTSSKTESVVATGSLPDQSVCHSIIGIVIKVATPNTRF